MTDLLTQVEAQIRDIVGDAWDDAKIEAEARWVVTSACDAWDELRDAEPIGRIEVYGITGFKRPSRWRRWYRKQRSWLN